MDTVYKTAYEYRNLVFDFYSDMTMPDEVIASKTIKYTWITADNLAVDATTTIKNQESNDNSTVTLNIKGGTNGYKYIISVDIVTNYNNSFKQFVFLVIGQKVIKLFNKNAGEDIFIDVDFSNEVLTDTITTRSVTAIDLTDGSDATSTVVSESAIDGKLIHIGLVAGTIGRLYQITVKADTNNTTKFQKDVIMFVNADFIDTTTTATKVVFIDSPANTTIGTTLGTAPNYVRVQIQTSGSAGVSTSGVLISMILSSGTGALLGTMQKATDASGYAIFNDLNLTTTGAKQITASCLGLTSAVSGSFTIS